MPGAVASEAARWHDLAPQHMFVWRKAARSGLLSLPAEDAPFRSGGIGAAFRLDVCGSGNTATTISIEIGGAVVRAAAGFDSAGCAMCCGP
ncbi:transposase [Bradyrhizobium sp. 186]|nr:transposase [Bradyrhizobium sp. 186]